MQTIKKPVEPNDNADEMLRQEAPDWSGLEGDFPFL